MQLSNTAIKLLESRYLLQKKNGIPDETPKQLFERVARAIAHAELNYRNQQSARHWEKMFFKTLTRLEFLPNSPTLMNAGIPGGQLSACFVLPVEDSMSHIFSTLKTAALIQKSGGGTGFNFSRLRPKGSFIHSTGGASSGPVSFIKIFDAATENIRQGGKRRGANMAILNADHPDIETFITSKTQEGSLKNFNISIGVTDAFMHAIKEDKDWALLHPSTKETVKVIRARNLWNKIAESAWENGDPGLLFLDTINRSNPTPSLGRITATNPCGEVPLLDYEPCNLGSINLSKMLAPEGDQLVVDWHKLQQTIRIGIRFLDNVIDVNNYLLPEIQSIARGNRKIGLGVMGWAEMLIQLGIPYQSEEALALAGELMQFIQENARLTSIDLARQRGVFPHWEESIYFPDTAVRNATCTSIAPTGSISIIANTSSSIEPLFGLAFSRRHVLEGATFHEINPLFLDYLKKKNLYRPQLLEVVKKQGFLPEDTDLPDQIKRLFRTSLQIPYSWHIKHQVAFQRYTDNAVSKTINMPYESTVSDVKSAYKMAWELGAKGITVFRYGCKSAQVLNMGLEEEDYGVAHTCKVCIY